MQKKYRLMIAAIALLSFGGVVNAAQDTTITQSELRNPRTLETWLEANALDCETRLAALGSTASSSLVLTNGANAGACYLQMTSDDFGDAGDRGKLNFADGGDLTWGTDADSKGTVATKLTVGKTGIVTMKGSATLDNTTDAAKLTITETTVAVAGAFDADSVTVNAAAGIDVASAGALGVGATTATSINFGSASVTAHTFTSDGTGTSEVVLPAGSIDSTEILDGTIVAGDIGDSELAALAAVSSGANKIPYFTGAGSASVIASSANVITFLAAADNAAMADIIAAAITEGDIANSTIVSADIKDGDIAEADLKVVDSPSDEDFLTYEVTTGDFEWHSAADVAGTIAAAITEGQLAESIVVTGDIKDGTIREADLMIVDSATDEDVLTYESSTGDFEWHSVAEIIGQMAAGGLPNDSILEADLKAVDTAADEDFLSYEETTGDFEWHSAAEIAGKFTEGVLANSIVVSADIKDGEIADADVSATAAIAQSKLACSGIGTAVAAAASSSETADGLVVTVITFTNVVMVATDTSDEGESVQVFDFDAGAFTILSAVLNATATVSAGANTGNHYLSLGTVAAADDSGLTSTEADVIPSVTLTENGALAADGVLAAPIVMDGTGVAKQLFVNWAVPDASMNADVTNTVSGTITLITTKAIDN